LILTKAGPGNTTGTSSISWVTGCVAGHPNQPSLEARNITSSAYSWGLAGHTALVVTTFPFYDWDNATVVGAAQAGNQLIISHFEDLHNIADHSASLTKQWTHGARASGLGSRESKEAD
jgi:hypothetical protein